MTDSKVDELDIKLAFPGNTRDAAVLERTLAALEQEPLLVPTHADPDERKRTPYARAKLVQAVTSTPAPLVVLARHATPTYRGALTTSDASYNVLHADYVGGVAREEVAQLFAATTRLAEALQPEFGFVHMLWRLGERSETYNMGIRVKLRELVANGLASLHARTWLGPELSAAIGEAQLLALPGASRTAWGGVQLDLVEKPWEADFEALRAAQEAQLATLAAAGVVGSYSGPPVRWRPAPRWQPPAWQLGGPPKK